MEGCETQRTSPIWMLAQYFSLSPFAAYNSALKKERSR